MLKLPKVAKEAVRALTRAETVKSLVTAAAISVGIGAAATPQNASANTAQPAQVVVQTQQPSLLLLPAGHAVNIIADHYSHESHSSHSSHASHQSHSSHYSSSQ